MSALERPSLLTVIHGDGGPKMVSGRAFRTSLTALARFVLGLIVDIDDLDGRRRSRGLFHLLRDNQTVIERNKNNHNANLLRRSIRDTVYDEDLPFPFTLEEVDQKIKTKE